MEANSNEKKDDAKSNNNNIKKKQKASSSNKDLEDDNAAAMSEEDKALKERLETCVTTLTGKKPIGSDDEKEAAVREEVMDPVPAAEPLIQLKALQMITTELRSATSSMTSVPKPLKFLRPYYDDLVQFGKGLEGSSPVDVLLQARMSDVLSVLSMTFGDSGKSLSYRWRQRVCLCLNDHLILKCFNLYSWKKNEKV